MTQCVIISPKRSGHNFIKSVLRSWRPDLEMLDWENFHLNRFQTMTSDHRADTIYVLNTRDLLNWAASTIRQHKREKRLTHTRMINGAGQWYRISREFYRETEFTYGTEPLRILYDRFIIDRAYRQRLCAAINGTYTEEATHQVPGGGGGSSFDGFRYQGMAENMSVLSRYLELDDVERHYLKALWRVDGLVPFYRRIMRPSADKVAFLRQTYKIII